MKKLLILLTLPTLFLFGCSNNTELQEVTVILDYVANTNHTGLFVAIENGYFEDVGLDVTIIEPSSSTVSLVATGKGDIGITYQETLTTARASSEPLPVVAIATILQNNTSGFASHISKNIEEISDFEGKTYAGWGGLEEEMVLQYLMETNGADFDLLDIVMSDGLGIYNLEGDIDIIWTYEAWDNIQAELLGIELNYIPLNSIDERLDYYTPIIFTNEDTIQNDPLMLSKFMEATTRGYAFSIENPTLSAEILYNSTLGYDLEMLILSQEYLASRYINDASVFGIMESNVWDRYTELLFDYGLISSFVPSNECFTNDFLYYGN